MEPARIHPIDRRIGTGEQDSSDRQLATTRLTNARQIHIG
jgi:hypothetical protein